LHNKLVKKNVYEQLQGAWSSGNADHYNELVAANIDAIDPDHEIGSGRTAFWLAAATGATAALRLLYSKRKSAVNAICKSTGWTSLHAAVFWNHVAVVNLLLSEMRAQVDPGDKYGQTPLMRAALDGKEEMVEKLLLHGAKVDACDLDQRTALMLAANRNRLGTVKLLLQQGKANRLLADKNGRTAKDFAASGAIRDMLSGPTD
jgi:ankyrin repeat protein